MLSQGRCQTIITGPAATRGPDVDASHGCRGSRPRRNRRAIARPGRLARWLLASLVLVAWQTPHAMAAGEPAGEFVKRLRNAGYFDTALRYLERLDEFPGVDPSFRQAIALERAQVAIDAALAARKPADRDSRFVQAEGELSEFLRNDAHPRVSEARSLLGTIRMARGQQLMMGDPDSRTREAARESYLAAAETFDSITDRLREELKQMQGARIDAEKEPEKAALRDRYRNEFLNAQLQGGNARYRAAMTLSDPRQEGQELLEKAAAQFTDLSEEYGKYVPGVIALVYRGQTAQALGRNDEAVDSYLRMLEKPDADAIRESKLQAITGLIQIWLAESPPKYGQAIDRGQAMVSSLRPNERGTPAVQDLRVALAKAYLAKAEDKENHKTADLKRATANGRRLLNEAKRIPGDHLAETQRLLGGLGIDTEEPEIAIVEDPGSLDEAIEVGTRILENLETIGQSLTLIRDRVDPSEEVEAQIADLEQERVQLQTTGVQVLRRGLALAGKAADRETVDRARELLTYLLYQQQRYREAAVVAGYLARTSPGTEIGLRNGLLALNSFQLLIAQSGEAVGAGMLPHVEELGEYLATTWPQDPDAAAARGVMVQLALRNDRWEEARRLLEEMPDSGEKARFQRLFGQLTWNRGLEARSEGDDEAADRLVADARDRLAAGLESLAGERLPGEAMQAGLILAKAQLRGGEVSAALATLDHTNYGPLARGDLENPPSEGFLADLYGVELQAVVGRMSDPESDGPALLARAESAMQKLRDAAGKDGQSKLLGILVRLARDIREQIDATDGGQKQRLIDAFRLFVGRIAESSEDPATLQWVGGTLLQMGDSLVPADGKADGQAAELIATATQAFEELIAGGNDSPTVRFQLARAQRMRGQYKRAIDEAETILRQNPNMLDAQIEAALAYEQWAAEVPSQFRGKAYRSALVGARPDASGQNVIWGWGKISQMTSRDPKFRDRFFEARYRVALCRFLMGRALEDRRVIEKAITDVTSVASLYPDLGGSEQRRKFDLLLKQIQRELGQPATGLAS